MTPTPLLAHDGWVPEGFQVTNAGVRIATRDGLRKYVSVVNASDTPVYLALQDSSDGVASSAVVGRGIYLAPNGGAYEINNTNIYFGEIWAIHGGAGTKTLCVQRGK